MPRRVSTTTSECVCVRFYVGRSAAELFIARSPRATRVTFIFLCFVFLTRTDNNFLPAPILLGSVLPPPPPPFCPPYVPTSFLLFLFIFFFSVCLVPYLFSLLCAIHVNGTLVSSLSSDLTRVVFMSRNSVWHNQLIFAKARTLCANKNNVQVARSLPRKLADVPRLPNDVVFLCPKDPRAWPTMNDQPQLEAAMLRFGPIRNIIMDPEMRRSISPPPLTPYSLSLSPPPLPPYSLSLPFFLSLSLSFSLSPTLELSLSLTRAPPTLTISCSLRFVFPLLHPPAFPLSHTIYHAVLP